MPISNTNEGPMKPVRLGVIGCGVIGNRAHITSATESDLCEMVAVADILKDRADTAAEKYNVKAYYSGKELIEDDSIEAVSLALPAGVRTPLALRAIRAGKHVLIEKPIASTRFEVDQMEQLRGDLTVACCSSRFTFNTLANEARKCVESGALGDLRIVRCRAIIPAGKAPDKEPPPWRESHSLNGGGYLVNWGCYDLDFLMYICGWGLKPETVYAQTWPIAPELAARVAPTSDADAHFTAMIRCNGGAVISFERAEFSATAKDEQWIIIGSKGSLRMRMLAGKEEELLLDKADPQEGTTTECIWKGDTNGSHNLHMMENFAKTIRGEAKIRTGLDRAGTMQSITDAIYASARTGNAISI